MSPKGTLTRLLLGLTCGVVAACSEPPGTLAVSPVAEPPKPLSLQLRTLHKQYGAPTMSIVAPEKNIVADKAEAVAWATLMGATEGHKLSDAAVRTAKLVELHDAGNGPLIARFAQEVDGIPVFLQHVSIALDRTNQPRVMSGRLATVLQKVSERFELAESVAVETALRSFSGGHGHVAVLGDEKAAPGGYVKREAVARWRDGGNPAQVHSRSKKVYFAGEKGLIPSYYVELDVAPEDSTDSTMRAFVVSATDGRVLFEKELTDDAANSFRVYADGAPGYVPWDGSQGNDYTPYPKPAPDGSGPTFKAAALVAVENIPFSRNDPWLPNNPTELSGNNGWAYVDHLSPDGFSAGDLAVTPTAPGVFDRAFDPGTTAPSSSDENKRAVATNFFFIVNYLHDVMYDAGWTEAAQNPQKSNFGRGGVEGDPIRLEAQDASGRNNANASTPADGGMPRIQMYLWDAGQTALKVTAPSGVAGTYDAGSAGFGPRNYNVSQDVVAALDAPGAGGSTTDACDGLTNAAALAGKIALVDRGNCPYTTKVKAVQNAGAVGAIIANNAGGAMGLGGTDATITIPGLGISQADGAKIRTAVGAGTVTATLSNVYSERDSSLDGTIVTHEWGHVLSNRLVGSGSGLGNQQGRSMGEGWSDFLAMLITIRPEDAAVPTNANWNGTYSTGAPSTYAAGGNAYYSGIRRYPYSTDKTKNPLTFKHIENGVPLPATPTPAYGADGSSNSEVHNSGEVWANTLWECYAALLRDAGRLSFEQAQARMRRYLVASLKLTPANPTFTEARDAVLLAALSSDRADYDLFVDAFAKRGMGSGAASPDRADANHKGVVESFQTGADLTIVPETLTLDQTQTFCDSDGVLDNGEQGSLRFKVFNAGNKDAQNGVVTVAVASDSPVLVNGGKTATVKLPTMGPLSEKVIRVPVSLAGAQGVVPVRMDLEVTADNVVKPTPVKVSFEDLGNYDMKADTATVDKFSGRPTNWSVKDDPALDVSESFALVITPQTQIFHGPDTGEPSDRYLISPNISVGTSAFTLSFKHRYSFETDSTPKYWDGSVVEYSIDSGKTWADITTVPGIVPTNGYNGAIQNTTPTASPLLGRPAFVGASAGFATGNFMQTSYNLGTALAGQTMQVRFRIGTDDASGDYGWDIDEVAVTGAKSPPFQQQVAQNAATVCKSFVISVPDLQNIPIGFQVRLDPTISNPPGPLFWSWTQVDGNPVQLMEANTPNVRFTAPDVPTLIHLAWTATSGDKTAEGIVAIDVVKAAQTTDPGTATGCNLSVAPVSPFGAALWTSALLLLTLRRRRSR